MKKLIIIYIFCINLFGQSSNFIQHISIQSPSVSIWANEKSKSIGVHFGEEIKNNFGYRIFLRTNYFQNPEIQYQNRFSNLAILGFQFYSFQFLAGIEKSEFNTKVLIVESKIYPTQSICFQYKENQNYKSYFLSNLKGDSLKLGLGLGKNIYPDSSEWTAGVSVSLQINSFDFGLIGTSKTELNTSTPEGFIKYNFEIEKNSIFQEEPNPTYKEKENNEKKTIPNKKFIKKEKIIYELSLDILLKNKIPLAQAILISNASKNPEEYKLLQEKLSIDITKKCKRLQYEKSLEDKNE